MHAMPYAEGEWWMLGIPLSLSLRGMFRVCWVEGCYGTEGEVGEECMCADEGGFHLGFSSDRFSNISMLVRVRKNDSRTLRVRLTAIGASAAHTS